ncbi:hypothetical protein [Paenibacillus sp. LK1]|uniref:hypothetical protein n=1 Tax=Paenibacillus sp. LK1 TaxID=2053014 RepID=UPI000C1A571B|nr:hypothetical protein [Paenibacillus sp. LK1]PIH55341.1 hypothetical protein CS562_32110 [Paenibacillus sp. LK1]
MYLGRNVKMGPYASISWDQVANQPFIPRLPDYIQSTYINSTQIFSPNIYGGTIAIGSGNNIFKADTRGIYLGHNAFENANFKVSMDGKLTAVNGMFSGTIDGSTITGGTIRTAGANADRIELSRNGFNSYNLWGEKNGVSVDSGNFSSLDFYYRGEKRGGLSQAAANISLQSTMGDVIVQASTYGKTQFRGTVDFTDAKVKGMTAVFG